MKKTLSALTLAGLIASPQSTTAHEKDNFFHASQPETTVCNSNTVVKNASERAFLLIEWPETGRNTLTYCYRGRRIMVADTATGAPKSDGGVYTPEGNFQVGVLKKDRVSKKYNAPMPNSIHVHKGIFIHEGQTHNSQGKLLKYASHGCIRLGENDSIKLYQHMKNAKAYNERVEVIIRGTNPYTKKDGK